MRYLIKYTKESHIKFISHLDLMRTIQRIIRRAELPIIYSKGFNPHMSLSIAQPLSVGVYSRGEYMDIELEESVEEKFLLDKLNSNSPSGIQFVKIDEVIEKEGEKKLPTAMALVDAADYRINIKYEDIQDLDKELNEINKKQQWLIIKKGKSGEKEIDIKPLVKKIKYLIKDNILEISCLISCGSRENLSADLLAEYIKSHTSNGDLDAFTEIERMELYKSIGKKLSPLIS